MKIILSRKGFDSEAGGYQSPFFIEEGRLLSLPIPEVNKIYTDDTGWRYSDLKFNDIISYLDIMNQIGIKDFTGKNAHVDPDINPDILENRKPGWKGLFGQCDAAQQHLYANSIKPGDIFLFFGWFRDVRVINGKLRYISGTDKHIIWGYMQIGEIDSISNTSVYEPWKLDHPHYRNRKRKHNTGYVACDYLDFCPELPGYGVLRYDESLVLTCPYSNRSIWKLPSFFHPSFGTKITYNMNGQRWTLKDDHCILESAGRGQEFVITGNPQVVGWAKQLLLDTCMNKDVIAERGVKITNGNNAINTKTTVNVKQKSIELNLETTAKPFDNNTANINTKADNVITMTCIRRATGEKFEVRYNVDDIEKVKQYEWKVEKNRKKVYAVKQGTKNIFLHRLIAGNCEGKRVIAINDNYFDCRRENLSVKG